MQRQTVNDVERTLTSLLGVITQAQKGNREELEEGAYDYARQVVGAAERPLKKLEMYEAAVHAVNESERLVLAGQFDEADKLLLGTVREMMEKSGTNARLRTLYTPKE